MAIVAQPRKISKESVLIKQIWYKPIQVGMIDPDFEGYRNTNSNKWLENQVIVDLRRAEEHKRSNYFGVFSVKFRNKLGKTGFFVKHLINKNSGGDVYGFHGAVQNMWKVGDNWHPDFSYIGEQILSKIGYKGATNRVIQSVYSNHFISRSDLFERYVDEMLLPAMDVMENNKRINALVNRDACYTIGFKGEKVADRDTCMQVFGKPYYTYHPFICERLFATWADWNGIKIQVI